MTTNTRTDIRLPRDNDSDLLVRSPRLRAEASSYEEGKLRWTELRLWTSLDGTTIAEQVGISNSHKEHDRCKAWVCESDEQVVEALRRGWLARRLFKMAGIDDTTVVL